MNLNIKFNLQKFDNNYGSIIIPEPNPFKINKEKTHPPRAPPPSPVDNKKKQRECPFRCCS